MPEATSLIMGVIRVLLFSSTVASNKLSIYGKINVRASRSRSVYRRRCVPPCVKNKTTSAQPGSPSSQIHLQCAKYMTAFVREARGGALPYVQ